MKADISAAARSAITPKAVRERRSLRGVLLELRTISGMTQAQAAKVIGVSRASLANMETGRQAIAIECVESLAKSLGLEVIVTVAKSEGSK
jgi:DNA-binding XRE family transcriptional regulator